MGPFDTRHARETRGDDLGDLFMVLDPEHRDEVELAGNGVSLGDARYIGEGRTELRDRVSLRFYQDDGGDHGKILSPPTRGCHHGLVAGSTVCPGSHVELPASNWEWDPSRHSSPECWQLYGEVSAFEVNHVELLRFHQITVDA